MEVYVRLYNDNIKVCLTEICALIYDYKDLEFQQTDIRLFLLILLLFYI